MCISTFADASGDARVRHSTGSEALYEYCTRILYLEVRRYSYCTSTVVYLRTLRYCTSYEYCTRILLGSVPGSFVNAALKKDSQKSKNPTMYQGNMSQGQMNGQGRLSYPNGECYDGAWSSGERHGHGCYQYRDGSKFEGEWKHDKIDGKGIAVYSNGNRYEGEWREGAINGFGTLTLADGDRYVGRWSDGKMHGKGTYYYSCGDVYDGEWSADHRHGRGTMTFRNASGKVMESYEGQWIGDKMVCL